jgi:predicted RNase H-like HicB family nuclease
MTFAILFEKIEAEAFPAGYYYAHIPSLGLTTHGLGIEGAEAAAKDLIRLWVAEKRACGEEVTAPSDCFFATLEVAEHALQSS